MKKLYIEQGEVIPAIQVLPDTDPQPSGYDDGTTIQNWDKYYIYEGLSYSQVRKEIQILVIGIVQPDFSLWDNLTSSEKDIACKYCVAPYSLRIAHITEDEDKENWKLLLDNTILDRRRTVELMRREMGEDLRNETLTNVEGNAFFNDTRDMLINYEFTANPEFYEWLTNKVGSTYEFNGFAQKSYYTLDRKQRLELIYNGEY